MFSEHFNLKYFGILCTGIHLRNPKFANETMWKWMRKPLHMEMAGLWSSLHFLQSWELSLSKRIKPWENSECWGRWRPPGLPSNLNYFMKWWCSMHNYQINTAALDYIFHGISCHKASKFSESHNFNKCITLLSTFDS